MPKAYHPKGGRPEVVDSGKARCLNCGSETVVEIMKGSRYYARERCLGCGTDVHWTSKVSFDSRPPATNGKVARKEPLSPAATLPNPNVARVVSSPSPAPLPVRVPRDTYYER